MAELELNPETVQGIIELARDFQTMESAESEDINVERELAESAPQKPGDIIFQELKTIIEDLEPDQQVTLVALMWTGRGDFTVDEWPKALNHAQESWNDHTAEYLIGTPLLADYLAEGLDSHGK